MNLLRTALVFATSFLPAQTATAPTPAPTPQEVRVIQIDEHVLILPSGKPADLPLPGFDTEYGYVAVLDGACDANDEGTQFYVGPDGAWTFSDTCNDAVKQWLFSPMVHPKQLPRA